MTVRVSVQADGEAEAAETAALRDHVRFMLDEHELDVTYEPLQAGRPAGAKRVILSRSVRWWWRWQRPAVC